MDYYYSLLRAMPLSDLLKTHVCDDDDFYNELSRYCCNNGIGSNEIFDCLAFADKSVCSILSEFINICDKSIYDHILAHASKIDWTSISKSICWECGQDNMSEIAGFVNRFSAYIDWSVIRCELSSSEQRALSSVIC